MGSAPAADPAPTWLDAPHCPLHPGPPPVHRPITRTSRSLGGPVSQSTSSMPSRWPQGKKLIFLSFHLYFYFQFSLVSSFSVSSGFSLFISLYFLSGWSPLIPLSLSITHKLTVKSITHTYTRSFVSFFALFALTAGWRPEWFLGSHWLLVNSLDLVNWMLYCFLSLSYCNSLVTHILCVCLCVLCIYLCGLFFLSCFFFPICSVPSFLLWILYIEYILILPPASSVISSNFYLVF